MRPTADISHRPFQKALAKENEDGIKEDMLLLEAALVLALGFAII